MFTLNTNPTEDIVASYTTIGNLGSSIYMPMNYLSGGNSANYWLDKTNKYLYLVYSQNYLAPRFRIERYTYGDGKLSNPTPIALSGFGTFTSSPTFNLAQGSHSGNFSIYWSAKGGSSSITDATFNTVTISGTTATLGATITPPTVSSYSFHSFAVYNSNIFVWYGTTASPYTPNECRKWDGSGRSTLSGDALPHTIINANSYAPYVASNFRGTIGAGLNNEFWYTAFYCGYTSGGTIYATWLMKFDMVNEIWILEPGLNVTGGLGIDINGYVFGLNQILCTDGKMLPFTSTYSGGYISDIKNGLMYNSSSTNSSPMESIISFSGGFVGSNSRLKKIGGYNGSSFNNYGCVLYSIDGGTTFQTTKRFDGTINGDIGQNVNVAGNLVVIAHYQHVADGYLSVEIVS